MTLVRFCGLIVFALVVVATSVDIAHAIRSAEPHALITTTHLGMLTVGIFALSLTSENVSDRFIRFIMAARGVKHKTDEHPRPKIVPPRRRRKT